MSFEVNSSDDLVGKQITCSNYLFDSDPLNDIRIGLEFLSKKKVKIYESIPSEQKVIIKKLNTRKCQIK